MEEPGYPLEEHAQSGSVPKEEPRKPGDYGRSPLVKDTTGETIEDLGACRDIPSHADQTEDDQTTYPESVKWSICRGFLCPSLPLAVFGRRENFASRLDVRQLSMWRTRTGTDAQVDEIPQFTSRAQAFLDQE